MGSRNIARLIPKLGSKWSGFTSEKTSSTHCTGDWEGTRAGLDRYEENTLPPPGSKPRNLQPVASHTPTTLFRPVVSKHSNFNKV
jgi:hypothetical protein